jgi:hypothetical protein
VTSRKLPAGARVLTREEAVAEGDRTLARAAVLAACGRTEDSARWRRVLALLGLEIQADVDPGLALTAAADLEYHFGGCF